MDGSGYLGRVGEYDSLEESAGTDFSQAYVSTATTSQWVVSRGNVISGDDYSAATQLTAGEWVQVGLFIRSFVQQQDNYRFYAFPALDIPPGSTTRRTPRRISDVAQHALHTLRYFEEIWIKVADDRLGHRLVNARGHLAGPRAIKKPLRRTHR